MRHRARRGLLALGVLLAFPVASVAAQNLAYPRLANYYLTSQISEGEARQLARWDVVIMGYEVPVTSPAAFALIRQLNPQVVLLGYIDSIMKHGQEPQVEPLRAQYRGTRDEWLLRSPEGGTMSFWPGTKIVNPTDFAPLVGGKRWNDFLPEFTVATLQAQPGWSGIFFDDGMADIAWLNYGNIDINNDGTKDSSIFIDDAWRGGMYKMFGRARMLAGPGRIIVANSSNAYGDHTNGRMFENYFTDKGSWQNAVSAVHDALAHGGYTPRLAVINANTENRGDWQNWQKFRYAFASALMTDAYFSYDHGDAWHQQVWWYDEYDADLGAPLNNAHVAVGAQGSPLGVWRRDFEYGAALVNTTSLAQTVALGEQFRRLQGAQDPIVNSGATADTVTIGGYDGLVLARVTAKPLPPAPNQGNGAPAGGTRRLSRQAFVNFTPAEVRNAVDGTYLRAWELKNDAIPRQAFGFSDDLDGNGTEEAIVWNRGTLTAATDAGLQWQATPYDATWRGRVEMASGDLDGDGKREIVLVPGKGGGPHVRVVGSQGKVVGGFFAGNAASRTGASLALADLNADGRDEIIVGAGAGGEANVMVFGGGGALVTVFNAFALPYQEGLNVAAGDLDGNGTTEIAAGSGSGAPRVRIFDAKGTFLREIIVGNAKSTAGARILWWNVPPYQPHVDELLLSTGRVLNFPPDKPTLIIVK